MDAAFRMSFTGFGGKDLEPNPSPVASYCHRKKLSGLADPKKMGL